MMCDICGKKNARIRHITRSYGKGAKLLIIENIPAVRCPSCGETYLSADTLHEIELIKLHSENFAARRNIPVADFA